MPILNMYTTPGGRDFSAEYQSGYFADIIGFDASYYSAIKLGASDYFNSRGVLL